MLLLYKVSFCLKQNKLKQNKNTFGRYINCFSTLEYPLGILRLWGTECHPHVTTQIRQFIKS